MEKLAEGGWTVVWDNEQQVPHAYKGDQWIGYDDPAAIALKVANSNLNLCLSATFLFNSYLN